MAKLTRKSAKVFAEDASANVGGVAQFGSLAAGNANYSKDPDVIQGLTAYKNGWSAAVVGNKSPAMEDRNALDYVLSYQLAYLMQRGIPEWLSSETYYNGSFVSIGQAIYVSKSDNNINHNPSTDTSHTYWDVFPTPAELATKVSKSGDTMSGPLRLVVANTEDTSYNPIVIRDNRMDRDAAGDGNVHNGNYISLTDKNNVLIARIFCSKDANGANSITIHTVTDTTTNQAVSMGVKTSLDGTTKYAWCPTAPLNVGTNQIVTAEWVRNMLAASQSNGLASYSFGTSESYMKFQNGLLLQWGQMNVSTNTIHTVSLPQPFANTSYVALKNMNSAADGNTEDWQVSFFNRTTTTMQTQQNPSDASTFQWFAIGNWK